MKQILHSLFLFLGIITWIIGVVGMALTTWLAVAGEKLIPNHPLSNCWIFSLNQYWKRGGYLLIRPADDVRLFKRIKVPHVIYLPSVPEDLQVEQYVPIVRSKSKWLPWRTLFYKGTVKSTERPHNSNGTYR